MPSIAFTPIENKRTDTAEFRRLLYFFQKLQEPRPRVLAVQRAAEHLKKDTEDVEDGSEEVIPRDLAPLAKNLAVVLRGTPREEMQNAPEALFSRPSTPRQRSKTIATPTASYTAPAWSPAVSMTPRSRFPLQAKNYVFTFKLYLHKLYDVSDWRNKVGALLAESQARYRPLADGVPAGEGTPLSPNSTAFSPPTSPTSPVFSPPTSPISPLFSPPTSPTSRTSLSPPTSPSTPGSPADRRRAMTGSKKQGQAVLGVGMPSSAAPRAVKRRIVDRRRSLTITGEQRTGGWVYDARASAVETKPRDEDIEHERRRKRVGSSLAYSEEQKIARRVSERGMLKRERIVQAGVMANKRSRVD
ncbi:hypothetical protein K488DRAFT_73853 [Vararia minispora EC-137]|uniref:Uncharacterized protein n=1 Tax=Vararia minispora EC-137 TaxID=1314806 RepID=A0ACB8Q940_9AGAM|nr:hypothetical protein K488DRAFT_73853 [Vararia minispora EC-137]